MELIVVQLNINPGYNDELLISCPTLWGYMKFVEKIRENQRTMPLTEAVTCAVNACIQEGILTDFLKKHKAEVIAMSLYEYDEKKHERTMMDIGREQGETRKLVNQIIKKVQKQKDMEQIADELEEDTETILPLYDAVIQSAPDYNIEAIMDAVAGIRI